MSDGGVLERNEVKAGLAQFDLADQQELFTPFLPGEGGSHIQFGCSLSDVVAPALRQSRDSELQANLGYLF